MSKKKQNKYAIIGSHIKLANLNYQFDVKIDEHCLQRARTYKYLGIDLDENLSWDSHLNNVVKKVSAGLGAIRHARNLVPRETIIMMYKALLFIPRPSTEAGKRSFQYSGSVLWNSLPLSAKTQPTISSFKASI